MADPRFFDNRGPFALAEVCARIGASLTGKADALLCDVASLESAGPEHLAFCATKVTARTLATSRAGFCLIDKALEGANAPASMALLYCRSALDAYVAVAEMFYPAHSAVAWSESEAIDKSAKIGARVTLAPGVVVGAGAEIGEGTRVGPNSEIGRAHV